jgi:hypothetical protein
MLTQGSLMIDWKDWKQFTDYESVTTPTLNVVIWFWEYVETLGQDDLQKLLKFATGSPRTSAGGFEFLQVCCRCLII